MLIGKKEMIIKYVAVYLRKSRGETIEDLIKHKTVLQELCEYRSWTYVLYEEIETGESLYNRFVMQQLLKDLQDDMFDAVVCVDLDRLGRGTLGEWDTIKRVFQTSNTYIVTPTSLYNLSDDADEFSVDLQTVFARHEYKKINKRFSMGKKVGAKLGRFTNGTPSFPYEYQEWIDPETHKQYYNEKGLVVNQQKLPTYRFIVDAFIQERKSTNEIAWELNRRGILSPRGTRWTNVSVRRLLIDETHLGRITYNKTKGDGHKNKPNKLQQQRIPRDQWIIVENCHEKVKTNEEHEQILIQMKQNSLSPFYKAKDATLLKGLVKCAKCGSTIGTEHRHGAYRLKTCWHRDEFGNKCTNSGGKAQYIIDAIDEQLNIYEDKIKQEIDSCEDQTTDLIQFQIKQIMDKIKKKDVALQRARVLYDEGIDTIDEYRSAKDRITKELDELENELNIETLKLKKAESINNHEKLHYIEEFKKKKSNGELSESELNALYKTIIGSIIWRRERGSDDIEIIVNFL